MPAPMIAPMPSSTRLVAPNARLSVCCPSVLASACRSVMLFVDHKPILDFSGTMGTGDKRGACRARVGLEPRQIVRHAAFLSSEIAAIANAGDDAYAE